MLDDPGGRKEWADYRDAVIVLTAIVLVLNEAFLHDSPRKDLLVLYAAMMGLPAYFAKRPSR